MSDFRADLHCHSNCSDGTFSPSELVKHAHNLGLQGLSITDHDTIDAYREALPVAQYLNLPLLSGVEFSAHSAQTNVHILAYGFDLASEAIKKFCEQHKQRRITRNQLIITQLAAKGMPLSEESIIKLTSQGSFSIGRPHIAQALMQQGYVKSIQEAFQLYLADDKPCFVNGQTFSIEETLDLIHKVRGFAIIAHPHLIDNPKAIKTLLSYPFDGIEVYYGRLPLSFHERWLKIAEGLGWMVTGGSDFHGAIKPNLPLGSSWVNQECFEKLYERHKQNNFI